MPEGGRRREEEGDGGREDECKRSGSGEESISKRGGRSEQLVGRQRLGSGGKGQRRKMKEGRFFGVRSHCVCLCALQWKMGGARWAPVEGPGGTI